MEAMSTQTGNMNQWVIQSMMQPSRSLAATGAKAQRRDTIPVLRWYVRNGTTPLG